MKAPGVEVRPLRQATGEAEFNEVFLTDVVIPDADRIGEVGQGWAVSTATLNNERVALGAFTFPREGGMIGVSATTWREHPELRTPGLHDKLLRLWADGGGLPAGGGAAAPAAGRRPARARRAPAPSSCSPG